VMTLVNFKLLQVKQRFTINDRDTIRGIV